jgi:endonuclease VIII
MPEGDTILRAATTLQRALAGKRVTRFESVYAHLARANDETPVAGQTIERVHAAGKHLLIVFSGGLTLRTHMRMNGSWHIYRPGERWQRPRSEMRIILATDDFVAVGFSIPVAEFLTERAVVRHTELRALGPDILAGDFDMAEALTRMRARGSEEIANVLLNQRVIAGIGNIYKSESLFLAGVNPFRHVDELTDEQLSDIIASARKLMRASVASTMPARRSVYERSGKPCRRCRTTIEYRKQGPDARGTHWCPVCQR